jgi:twitching motility protein PilT
VTVKKVLVVHDDAGYAEQVRQSLAGAGVQMQVVSALSGPRALEMVPAVQPDVVVVDAELIGMDGYALTERLKADAACAQVPVVIVSLRPTEASAVRARQVGAAAHVAGTGPIEGLTSKIATLAGVHDPGGSPRPTQTAGQAVGSAGAGVTREAYAPAATGVATATVPSPTYAGTQSAPVAAPTVPPPPAELPHYMGTPDLVVGLEPKPSSDDLPHIDDLLRLMLERGGSDLHLTVGSPPGIRQRGELLPVENVRPLGPKDTMEMILGLLSEEQRRKFETEYELDWAYSIPGVSRFRANVFQQRNSMGAVFRVIPIDIPTIEQLGLPKVCSYLADRPRGLVLVTGPTGSGKSTTLAAMVDHVNETRPLHIITLEDPIEFMHRNKRCYVNQREVGEDTHSFSSALKRVLRQDPDVILVGEMRDLETISAAITAAETGHLVFATLHTTGGPATVDRIIDVFPPHQQQQVRMQLSTTLEGVLSQTLLRSTDGRSRVMAMEIMLGIPAIQNLIREGKTHQMPTIIQGGASLGMQTLDQDLKRLLQAGKVTFEEAISKAQNPRELAGMVGRRL